MKAFLIFPFVFFLTYSLIGKANPVVVQKEVVKIYNPHFIDSVIQAKAHPSHMDSLSQMIAIDRTGHHFRKTDFQPIRMVKARSANDMVFLIFLFLGFLLVLVRSFYPEFFLSTRESLSNPNLFNQRIRDRSLLQLPALIGIVLFRIIVFAFGVAVLFSLLKEQGATDIIAVFLAVLISYTVYIIGKIALEMIIAMLTGLDGPFTYYQIQNQMVMGLFSLLLLPVLLFFYFTGIHQPLLFIYIILGLYVFFQIFNIGRLLYTGVLREVGFKFYFFVYFCALKMLPLLILVKFLMNYYQHL